MNRREAHIIAKMAADKLAMDNKCCKATRNKNKRRASKAVRQAARKETEG